MDARGPSGVGPGRPGDVDALIEAASGACAAAVRAGADDADVWISRADVTSVTASGGYVADGAGAAWDIAARGWCGGRVALLHTPGPPRDLAALARGAVDHARAYGRPDTAHLTAGERPAPDMPDETATPGDLTPGVRPASPSPAADGLRELVGQVARDNVAIVRGCYSTRRQWIVLANSRRFRGADHDVEATLWLWVERGQQVLALQTSGTSLDACTGDDLRRLVRDGMAIKTDRAAPSGVAAVLLRPAAAAGLVRAMAGMLTARDGIAVPQRLIGRRLCGTQLTLDDEPRGLLGARRFDDEGTPARSTRLISDGCITALLHTLASADRHHAAPAGTARRTAPYAPPVACHRHLRVAPGPHDVTHLRHELGEGLEVTGVRRLTTLPRRGLSLEVHGWWVRGGRRAQRVTAATVDLAMPAALRGVAAVGDDLTRPPIGDAVTTPTLLLRQATIT